MLIPSIDLQNGHVVQLIQGDKLAVQSDDLDSVAMGERYDDLGLAC